MNDANTHNGIASAYYESSANMVPNLPPYINGWTPDTAG